MASHSTGQPGKQTKPDPGGQWGTALQAELHVSQLCYQSCAVSQHEQPSDLVSRPVLTVGLCAYREAHQVTGHLPHPSGKGPCRPRQTAE